MSPFLCQPFQKINSNVPDTDVDSHVQVRLRREGADHVHETVIVYILH